MAGNTKSQERMEKFKSGLEVIKEAADKINSVIDGSYRLSSEEYMNYYSTIYNLSHLDRDGEFAKELYLKYVEILKEYITSKVLPALREKREQELLQELVKRWADFKRMTRLLLRFFYHLDSYLVPRRKLPSLNEVSFTAFHDLVYGELNDQIRNAAISMINSEREGEAIDRELVKSALTIYAEMGIKSNRYYVPDFEEAMLMETAAFYSTKASNCTHDEDYSLIVEESLRHEKEIVSGYLQATTQSKLMQVVEQEFLNAHAGKL